MEFGKLEKKDAEWIAEGSAFGKIWRRGNIQLSVGQTIYDWSRRNVDCQFQGTA